MSEPMGCTRCGYPLPGTMVPGATTCREWVAAVACKRGDRLPAHIVGELDQLLAFCALLATMRAGRETIAP
jgi:hypothetical protein